MKQAMILGALVVFGCGKAKDPGAGSAAGSATVAKTGSGSGSGSGSAATAATPATAAATTKAAAKAAKASAEQKATYKKQMKAGWAAQKDKKWADAATAFEAALVAVPNEQRALAELGWSAMNAGDYKKAKVIDLKVVATAHDPKVKASGYFNLGQVQEKLGDKPGALRSYATSIALRPNKTVEAALLALGADPKKPIEYVACQDAKTACDCLKELAAGAEMADDEHDVDERKCKKSDEAVAGTFHEWKLFNLDGDVVVQSALFDAKDRYVAALAYEASLRRESSNSKVEKIDVKTIGTHKVLWIERTDTDTMFMMNDEDTETTETSVDRNVTVCVIGDVTTCPLVGVSLHREDSVEHYNDDPKVKTKADTKNIIEVSVTIGDDGNAEVKLVKGSAVDLDSKLLGPHKLW